MTYPQRRRGGRFFGRRVNCELVPALPAFVVAQVLGDPREMPYLFVWKKDGETHEAVRIARYQEAQRLGGLDWAGVVEIKRFDGTRNLIRTLLRPLPCNGGKVLLLICPYCKIPRRALYCWEPWGEYTTSVRRTDWQCRKCAGLRHAAEGGALVLRSRWSFFRMIEQRYGGCRSPRPEPWYPYVFASPREAADAGLCNVAN